MKPAPAMTPQQRELSDIKRSPFQTYKRLAVGNASFLHFAGYELSQLLVSGMPGLFGLAARSVWYRRLFGTCGKRPAIGRGVVLRVPNQIFLGNGVLVDDYAALDVRGDDASIRLGNHVSVGRMTTIAAKGGHIELRDGCNVGSYCRIATNSLVDIGESVLIGAYCYVGPGNHTEGDDETPLIERPMEIKGGVKIGAHAWLGARVTVLDGVTIGHHAIIGAHALVKDDVPDWGVAVGVPAKVVKIRNAPDLSAQQQSL
jgi:acetyltransferase-like isoleucine patch superfamily enzyme